MRHRVDVQRDTSPEGADSPNWSGILHENVPCRVSDVGGDKSTRHVQLEAHITTLVEMRWLDGLRTDRHRLKFGDRLLSIERIVDRDGRRRWIELQCREVAA